MNRTHEVIIIGAGLSGLSAAHFLHKITPCLKPLILEKTTRTGGAIHSFKKAGFLAEWGPHGFLDNSTESRELLADLKLDKTAQKAPLGSFARFICHNGKLVKLPQNPKKLLSTPLLSCGGKLRLLADLFKKAKFKDQTIAEWAHYRFGKEVLPLVDAAVTGTFAGDYTKLSIDAVMPGVRQMEKAQGSILKGLLGKRKQKRHLPAMTSFPAGMEQLTTVLSQDKNIIFNTTVNRVRQADDGIWQLETDQTTYKTATLILALPVNQTLALLSNFKPPVIKIPTAKIALVAMGFSQKTKIPYGFGFLAPEKEKRFALGAMFSSEMFANRAPQGSVLVEALVGGRRHPERLTMSDEELTRHVFNDLSQLLTLPEEPWFSKVLRPTSGIPQLEMEYPALFIWCKTMQAEKDNLHICGFGWEGIGMNEMIKAAKRVATDFYTSKREKTTVAVKPVYF